MAVFTADQVKSINAYQAAGVMHQFTCDTDGCKVPTLRATEDGLVCDGCDYTQDWVHGFMANWEWAKNAAILAIDKVRVEHGLASVGMTLADLEGK